MALVADESVDSGIIKGLRQKGITVFSVSEEQLILSDRPAFCYISQYGSTNIHLLTEPLTVLLLAKLNL